MRSAWRSAGTIPDVSFVTSIVKPFCKPRCRSVYGCVASHFDYDNSTNSSNCFLKHTVDAAGATAADDDYTWFANCRELNSINSQS